MRLPLTEEMLWFDVEEGYNTTLWSDWQNFIVLWFDVEEGYNTTLQFEAFAV